MSKWIKDYEDMYKIYENGDVERYSKNGNTKILKHCIDSNGYKKLTLSKNGKGTTHRIHRLLALHFIENPNNYPIVDHIDRNPLNNNLDNLRWTTSSINCRNKKNRGECMQGVTKSKNGKKFIAKIWVNGKKIHLGTFNTELEAYQAYMLKYDEIMI